MQRQKRNLLTLGAIGCALGLFAILGIVQTQKSRGAVAIATDIPSSQKGLPVIGGPFELVDKDGRVWKNTDFKGKPMLVYFGYTYCPDICPTALDHLTKAMEELGGAKSIQPLFISIDPERDTPALLETYAPNFHQDIVMLTGSQAQIDQAIKAYRVHAARTSEKPEDKDYLMDHSSLIYLMDKDGQYVAHFDHQTPPAEIVQRVRVHLEKGE
jgi:cytochrome oxidase Cu insertion factor (SCO1/SenC/PrrC family)